MSGADANIPESVQELIEDFHAVPDADRLQLLLEFAENLPPLPPIKQASMSEIPASCSGAEPCKT